MDKSSEKKQIAPSALLEDKAPKEQFNIANDIAVTVLLSKDGQVSVVTEDEVDIETAVDMLLYGLIYLRMQDTTKIV